MAYSIRYSMLTGTSTREAFSAIEAVVEYRALQQAGAGRMAIVGPNGSILALADLLALASAEATVPSGKRPLRTPT